LLRTVEIRKESKTVADKLESEIEQHNEEKQADRNSTNLTSASHRQERVIENVLDETKHNIRNATREAARDIPQYTQTW
jgi:hypothetical protein